MKRASLAASVVLAFCVFSGQAFAVTMINYPVHYSIVADPTNNYVDFVITTDELGAITGITSLDGKYLGGPAAIQAVADPIFDYHYSNPSGPDYDGTTDNLFHFPAPYVDSSGIGFSFDFASTYRFVLFNSGGNMSQLTYCSFSVGDNRYNCTGALQEFTKFNFTVTPTPLPAAFPLFATGFGLFGLLSYRRKKKMQTATNRLCPIGA
jgi:hypothetical protein